MEPASGRRACLPLVLAFSMGVAISSTALGQQALPETVIVQLRPGSDPDAVRVVLEARHLSAFHGRSSDLYLFGLPRDTRVEEALARLAGRAEVDYAEPNAPMIPVGEAGPGGALAGAAAPAGVVGYGPVTVAVIDIGTDVDDPALRDRILRNPAEVDGLPGVDDDGNGYADDSSGYGYDRWYPVSEWFGFGDHSPLPAEGDRHGTDAALVAAGQASNLGVETALSENVRILPVRAYNVWGAAEALDYAVARGAKVVNMSMETSWPSETLRAALVRAREAGVLVVVGAGNGGQELSEAGARSYPSSFGLDNVVTVAAVDSEGKLWEGSNYGQATVDLAAVGVGVRTASGTEALTGTSYASPAVAFHLALLAMQHPDWNHAQLKERLLANARPFDAGKGEASPTRYGMLDPARTLEPGAPGYPDGPGGRATRPGERDVVGLVPALGGMAKKAELAGQGEDR
ncbi:MAG: S8 family serine peptidase [Planctomycetes bacterium]|nr:S8 family serine peptidase [Planctomycetota bacterium]